MQHIDLYRGYPSLPEKTEILNALLNDPPEMRWRVVRDLFRIKAREDREDLIQALQPYLGQTHDERIKHRIKLALQALHRSPKMRDYLLVREKGALKPSEMQELGSADEQHSRSANPALFPVVDFHIHPEMPDLKLFVDMRLAGVTHGVILARDTDPDDVDRPGIRAELKEAYAKTSQSHRMPFEVLLKHIKAHLNPSTRVSNQDVADWVQDYPDILFGFGSINLSKSRAYIQDKLEEMHRLGLKGIKFLPHAQFFNPSDNENLNLVFEYCRQTGTIIMSHTGCGTGPFEIRELSQKSHPGLWESHIEKHPDVTFVLAHLGAFSSEIPGIWLLEALRLGKKHRNVYADLAEVDWLLDHKNVVQEIRKTMGFDRILFGTDYPYSKGSLDSWSSLVGGIQTNTLLSSKEKRKVLGENGIRLLEMD